MLKMFLFSFQSCALFGKERIVYCKHLACFPCVNSRGRQSQRQNEEGGELQHEQTQPRGTREENCGKTPER